MIKRQLQLHGLTHTYYEAKAENAVVHVVALHGFGLSGRTFRHIAPLLNEAHVSLYALDLLGFGTSEKPQNGYSLTQYAELTTAFVEALSLDKPVLMGHSFGGLIALSAAILHETHFQHLILLAPGGFHPLAKLNLLADRNWAFQFMKRPIFKRLVDKTPWKAVFPNQESLNALLKMHGSHRHFDLDKTGLRDQMTKLTLPILLLWGNKDDILPDYVQKKAAEQLPHAIFKQIPNARHALYYDNPQATVAAIVAFLNKKEDNV